MLAFQASAITLTRGTKGADSTAAATALAQERLELLRSLPRGHASHTPGNYADANNPLTADGQPNGRYTVTWNVSNRNVPDNGLKSVIVTVAWNENGGARQVRFGGLVRCAEVPCT